MTVRLVALNGEGKPVEHLSSSEIRATAQGTPVAVLQLSSHSGGGPDEFGRSDSLVYLFPPMQANEAAQRAKAIDTSSLALHNPTITVISGDGAQVTGPEGSPQVNDAIGRLTNKNVGIGLFAQWQPLAMKAIRSAARASGRCIVVLNDSRHHLPPNTALYNMNSISAIASDLACELYVVEDAVDMPSQIPPTIGQVRHGQQLDASGQLVDVLIGSTALPLSASGEQISYSMKSALKEIQRNAAAIYWAELSVPAVCIKPPGCPLRLSAHRKDAHLHSAKNMK